MDISDTFCIQFLHFVREYWPHTLGTTVALLGISWATGFVRNYFRRRELRKRIELNKRRFEEKIDRMVGILTNNSTSDLITPERQAIVDLEILELSKRLRSGDLDPLDVLHAYWAKAILSTRKTNCIVDFIVESQDVAITLRGIPKEQRGPLFGIPISVKECFFVKGYNSTAGLTRFMDDPVDKDSTFVQGVRELGAVPFCLTNVPQTMKTYGCSNPVYGVTTHPLDPKRTPGGSSGGEASLIAQGGSILGLGGDIGGSLRNPAHFCGIVSLKPTSGRLYKKGGRPGGGGKVPNIPAVNGFMSRSVDGVILGMRSVLENSDRMAELDEQVCPIPWRKNLFDTNKKMKIGWYDEDGFFPTTPGCKRAVHEAVEILQDLGHEVVPFELPHLKYFIYTYFDFMLSDNGETTLDYIGDEILDQAIETNMLVYKTPLFIRSWIFKPILHLISPKLANLSTRGEFKSADLWRKAAELDRMIDEALEIWKKRDLDVIICPGFITPAPLLNTPGRTVPCISSCIPFNIADLPVGVLPITRVNDKDMSDLRSYPRREDLMHELVYQTCQGTVGLPLGVQIVGKRSCEETILKIMKMIEDNRSAKFP